MPMFWACLGEQRSALGTQTRAVLAAKWRKREREHQGITEHRLKVKQVSIQRVPVLIHVTGILFVTE